MGGDVLRPFAIGNRLQTNWQTDREREKRSERERGRERGGEREKFIGVFAKLRKATLSFVMSVCLSVHSPARASACRTRLPLV
jgi:hypothetical protein